MNPARMRCRRGSTLALVLCLYLALGAILGGAITMAATASQAGERDYRRLQALALAEAGVAEARADASPHGNRALGEGTYAWSAAPSASGRLVTAHGSVRSTSGTEITRTVRALLRKTSSGWSVQAWEEGP